MSVAAPAPSSPAAVDRGCICPDLHNGTDHQGIEWDDGWTCWAVRSDCPVHGQGLPAASGVANG